MNRVSSMLSAQFSPSHLVIGASSALAIATIKRILDTQPKAKIVALSRRNAPKMLAINNVLWVQTDYDGENLQQQLGQLDYKQLNYVLICNGQLETQSKRAEKSLAEFDLDTFLEAIRVNTAIPMLAIKHLSSRLLRKRPCKLIVFSARVASIDDNQLGGWYSYRASKAALNMGLKSAAIELHRTHPQLKLISFHPGTVDTPLSAAYQAGIKPKQLRSPNELAQQIFEICDNEPVDGRLSFIDWRGERIAW